MIEGVFEKINGKIVCTNMDKIVKAAELRGLSNADITRICGGVAASTVTKWKRTGKARPGKANLLLDLLKNNKSQADNKLRDILKEMVAVKNANILLHEISFRLGDIYSDIYVRIYHDIDEEKPFRFKLSHYIKTPEHQAPYISDHPCSDTEEDALQEAIKPLVDHYQAAVNKGHKPSVEWLQKNPEWVA